MTKPKLARNDFKMTPILYITPNRTIIKKKLDFSDIDPDNYCFVPELNIDTVRLLKEWINIRVGNDQKVLVLDLNKANNQIQNALLKTIEECPDYMRIIMYCETLQSILETIKSRCIVEIINISEDPKEKLLTIKELTDSGMSTKLASEELLWLVRGLSQSEKFDNEVNQLAEDINSEHTSRNAAYRLLAKTAKIDIKEYYDIMRALRIKNPEKLNVFLTDSPLLYTASTLK